MNEQELRKKIAFLEFVNDQLISEMEEIDEMMRIIGFTDGLQTVKGAAWSLYEGESQQEG